MLVISDPLCSRMARVLRIIGVVRGLTPEIPSYGFQQGYNRVVGFIPQRIVHVLVDITRVYCIVGLFLFRPLLYSSVAPTELRMSGKPPSPLFLS